MGSLRFLSPRLNYWLRVLHGYAGLFVSPFLVVFAVSAILLNHPSALPDPAAATRREVALQMTDGLKGMDLARAIMAQAGVSGEIDYFPEQAQGPRVRVPVSRPGQKITIDADLSAKTARIEARAASLGESLIYLHKYPGPHNANIRGNWVFTRLWGVLADGTVYLILFISATGIYIWLLAKAERKSGMVFVAAGCVCFALVVLALLR
jgi:hypothetical protein